MEADQKDGLPEWQAGVTAILDTNVIIRHLTGEPIDQGQAASRFLADSASLVLTDVVAAETVYVLQSVYKTPRPVIATALRALVAMRTVTAERPQIIRRSIDLFELQGMDFTDAYLVAFAEVHGVPRVASFDRGIDKAAGTASAIERLDPLEGAAES